MKIVFNFSMFPFSAMKKLLTTSLIFVLSVLIWLDASAQVLGDYQTSGAGTSWNVAANWQLWNGLGWVAPGASGYPGQTSVPGTVTILTGQTINANVTPPNHVG